MERTISVSTEVFAKIWSLREMGEETEDAILQRVLTKLPRRKTANLEVIESRGERFDLRPSAAPRSRLTWRDDVRTALEGLNGVAPLSKIYSEVREIRKAGRRSIPVSFEPVVRRTLEEHSSESQVYRGGPDLFWMPEGKGKGIWAIR